MSCELPRPAASTERRWGLGTFCTQGEFLDVFAWFRVLWALHCRVVLLSLQAGRGVLSRAGADTRVGVWSCRGPPECFLLFGSRNVGNGSSAFISFSKQGIYFWKGCGLSESREAGKSAGKEQNKWFARACQVLASCRSHLSVCSSYLLRNVCAGNGVSTLLGRGRKDDGSWAVWAFRRLDRGLLATRL